MKNIKRACIMVCLAALLGVGGCGGGGGGTSVTDGSPATTQPASPAPSPAAETAAPRDGGTAKLTWEAPAPDGNSTVAGYKISYGTAPGAYTKTIDVGQSTTFTIDNLPQGRYFFAVSAYDGAGGESGYSNEVSKDI